VTFSVITVVELHAVDAVSDELLLHTTGNKWKNNLYHKVSDASAEFLHCNMPSFFLFNRNDCLGKTSL